MRGSVVECSDEARCTNRNAILRPWQYCHGRNITTCAGHCALVSDKYNTFYKLGPYRGGG